MGVDQQRRLVLVRHSESAPVEGVPARLWLLTDEGRRRCAGLAERLHQLGPDVLVASEEPRAAETGRLVAERLGLPLQIVPGLHEHERDAMPWYGRERWERLVAEMFARPDDLVFGRQTAAQSLTRFASAVDGVLERSRGTVAVFTHGTVMTLLLAARAGVEPMPFWRALRMPDLVEVELPAWRIVQPT